MKTLIIKPSVAMALAAGDSSYTLMRSNTDYRGSVLVGSGYAYSYDGTIPGHFILTAELESVDELTKDFYMYKLSEVHIIKPVPCDGYGQLVDVNIPLEPCPDFRNPNRQIRWEYENWCPYIKGAKLLKTGEWKIPDYY